MNKKLIAEIESAVSNTILEFRKKDAKVVVDGKELPFGCSEHVADMQRTLAGLERIRDCFEVGSGNRLMYSQTCSRLRRLIKDLDQKNQTEKPAVKAKP